MSALIPTERKIQDVAQTWQGNLSDMRQGYEAARESRFLERPRDFASQGAGADYHYRNENDYYSLMEMSRHVERDDPVVGQGVGRFVTNTVQGGYKFQPMTGVDAVDRLQEELWLAWSDPDNRQGVDYAMKRNWHDYERLSVRRTLFDGDVGINPMSDGRLQALEGHRIRSPYANHGFNERLRRYVMHGVELNRKEQVTRYWVTKDENDGFGYGYGRSTTSYSRNVKGVLAWDFDPWTGENEHNFFHMYVPQRFSQNRGVTALAPVLNTAGMHADCQFAKLVQQQMASYVALIHKIPLSAAEEYQAPNVQTYTDSRGVERRFAPDMAPGSEYYPDYPDEEITAFSANIPNAEFFDQARMLLTFISCNIGMPLILFLLDANETNLSAWRGAVDQAKMHFREFQREHAARLHRPVMRWKMRRWLRMDRGFKRTYDVIGRDFFHHEWTFPSWPYVNPMEDAEADNFLKTNLLSSPRRIAASRSLDFADIVKETGEDNTSVIMTALDHTQEINKHPYIVANPDEKVTWREVLHPGLHDKQQQQLLDKNDESSSKRAGKNPEPVKPSA